jgi:DNA-binding NtrC family response regulator
VSASTTSTKKILIVEPDDALRAALVTAVGRRALIEAYEGFESARPRLSSLTFDLLVTNLRLGEYNGLHLVILVKFAAVETRAIVYADEGDLPLASNAQQVGAFFELTRRMPIVLPSYVGTGLPSRDRRNPLTFDRRAQPRGGRRVWDAHLIGSM